MDGAGLDSSEISACSLTIYRDFQPPPERTCLTLTDICTKYDITTPCLLQDWIKLYNGNKDFKQLNSGGAVFVAKGRKTTLEERIEIVSHCIANNKDFNKTVEQYSVSYQQI